MNSLGVENFFSIVCNSAKVDCPPPMVRPSARHQTSVDFKLPRLGEKVADDELNSTGCFEVELAAWPSGSSFASHGADKVPCPLTQSHIPASRCRPADEVAG